MTEEGCNGWKNRETWLVRLWIDNSQGDQEKWRETVVDAWDAAEPKWEWETKQMTAQLELMKRLEDEFGEANPVGDEASVWANLMAGALARVDWCEVAGALIENAGIEMEAGDEVAS